MKKQTIIAALSALFLLTSCYNYTDPKWPVAENDLLIAFPKEGEFYTYNDQFNLKTLSYKHFHNTDYRVGPSLITDKIYFGSSIIEQTGTSSEPTYEVKYSLFSVELDGTDLIELLHKEYACTHYDFSYIPEVFGYYQNRLVYEQSGRMYIYDLATQTTVFQSPVYEYPEESWESIKYYGYQYLGDDQLARISEEGVYVVKWNATLEAYEEILYPQTISISHDYKTYIDGVIIFDDEVYDTGSSEYAGPILRGVRYSDGTWFTGDECQAILDAHALSDESGLFTIERRERRALDITHTVTRKEDGLSRDLTKEYLIGLYPDLQTPYDTNECVLFEVQEQEGVLYLSFTYYRSMFIGTTHQGRILFAYDFGNETMTYLGYYSVLPYYPMQIIHLG